MISGLTVFVLGNLWVLIIAVLAERFGREHSANSLFWLAAIATALIPCVVGTLVIIQPDTIPVFIVDMKPHILNPLEHSPLAWNHSLINFKTLAWGYSLISFGLCGRTLYTWAKLQLIARKSQFLHTQVFVTDQNIPPLALSWPQRYVLISSHLTLASKTAQLQIIAHEKAHLKAFDPEITLILLLLQNGLWINPFFAKIVTSWRLAAELSADHAVIGTASLEIRRAYARLLISATAENKRGVALPCPSAHLTSNSLRSVKMRLNEIMTPNENEHKPTPFKRIAALTSVLALIGSLGMTVMATDVPIATAEPVPIKRVPPVMPKACPSDEGFTLMSKAFTADASDSLISASEHVTVGRVTLEFDVTADGVVKNSKVLKSTSPCFEVPSLDAVNLWEFSKTETGFKNIKNLITYKLAVDPDDPRPLQEQLKEYFQ